MKNILALAVCSWALHAAPFKPSDDSYIVESLPKSLQSLKQAQRDDWQNPLTRARAYLAIAQNTSDAAFIRYAEGILEKAAPQGELIFLRAVISQHKHDFAGALELLDALPAHHVEGALLRASILTTLGRYPEAREVFARNLKLTTTLSGLTQLLILTSLNGELRKSEQTLESALARGSDRRDSAFAWCALAEIAVRRGDRREAEMRFQRSLELEPASSYTLTAYCDLLLASGRKREVLEMIDPHVTSEALQTRRLLASDPELSAAQELADRLTTAGHYRELALLQLDFFHNAKKAIESAQANWARQREPIDAWLVLRAARLAKSPAVAQPVQQWLSETGLEDQRIAAEWQAL